MRPSFLLHKFGVAVAAVIIVYDDYDDARPHIKDTVIPTSHIHVLACSYLIVGNYDIGLWHVL